MILLSESWRYPARIPIPSDDSLDCVTCGFGEERPQAELQNREFRKYDARHFGVETHLADQRQDLELAQQIGVVITTTGEPLVPAKTRQQNPNALFSRSEERRVGKESRSRG